MPKRSSNSKPDPLQLTQELHAQIKACDRLPPPWDAYQTDDPPGYHDLSKRIAESLKIPSLGLSRHSIKPDESSERFDFFPDRVWTIEARPSFHSAGKIAVFESRSSARATCLTNQMLTMSSKNCSVQLMIGAILCCPLSMNSNLRRRRTATKKRGGSCFTVTEFHMCFRHVLSMPNR